MENTTSAGGSRRAWSTDISYSVDALGGDIVRVVIVGDVIALPAYGWCLGGFGRSVSAEWLLYASDSKFPAKWSKVKKHAIAACVVRALWRHHSTEKMPAYFLHNVMPAALIATVRR